MRPNAHIVKKQWSGIQIKVTIPRHFAEALGMWGPGYASFRVNDAGELVIENHPKTQEPYGNAQIAA